MDSLRCVDGGRALISRALMGATVQLLGRNASTSLFFSFTVSCDGVEADFFRTMSTGLLASAKALIERARDRVSEAISASEAHLRQLRSSHPSHQTRHAGGDSAAIDAAEEALAQLRHMHQRFVDVVYAWGHLPPYYAAWAIRLVTLQTQDIDPIDEQMAEQVKVRSRRLWDRKKADYVSDHQDLHERVFTNASSRRPKRSGIVIAAPTISTVSRRDASSLSRAAPRLS